MKEALFYNKDTDNQTSCFLCNHFCRIKDGHNGICNMRVNKAGVLYAKNYGKLVAANIDPIEKKPLFHFLPGTSSYSIASSGCNFKCGFCQNWEISQTQEAQGRDFNPQQVVTQALMNKCASISYTYTEPTIYFEFAYDCAKLAKENNIYNAFVTNGYMSKECLESISDYLDAANVDLKSYNESFYQKICKATLKPVLDNIILMKTLGIWIEITTLIIPDHNDSPEELKQIASFISSVDKNIPWHISRFHPHYKFNTTPPTPPTTLELAYKIGKEAGLNFIYIGNISSDTGENTYCPKCSTLLIERTGFSVTANNLIDNKCNSCNEKIEGVY